MKTLIASKMCMLYCALIVCSLASTVRTANTIDTTAVTKKILPFNSTEVTTESEKYDDFLLSHLQTTSIAISKESSTMTPGTPSVTDPNKLPHSDETMTGGFSNPPNLKLKPNKGNSVSGKRYNSSEQIPTNDDTRSNPKERVTMFALENRTKSSSTTKKSRTIWGLPTLSPITDVLLSHNSRMEEMEKKTVEQPTRPPMHRRNKSICRDPKIRKYLAHCQNEAKETTETAIQRKHGDYRQKMETTTIENEAEKKKRLELEQKMADMEAERFNSILNI
ncbi:Uncharacterized protein FWK35_00019611 [Aphis craccivora]|uniref:Uncharacterized protein n=1 Tax=Aphis craccivora TaxID=307492 RepID=A0A6G0YE54_APHCR|nr:Uncharacterized protein FWK35_00019611 [Aphis craccivora]